MSLRTATIVLSALFALLIPGLALLLFSFYFSEDFSKGLPYFGFVMFILSLPYVVTAVIALFMKKMASLLTLLSHSTLFFGFTCFIFLLIFAEGAGIIGNGKESAAPWALLYIPYFFLTLSPLFFLAAVITEIVLRCTEKHHHEPQVKCNGTCGSNRPSP